MYLLESLAIRIHGLFKPLIEFEPTKDEYWERCGKCGKKILLGHFVGNPDGSLSVGEYYQIPKDCTHTPDGSHVVGGL